MNQPFSGIPDPGISRRVRRHFQPGAVRQEVREMLREAQRYSKDLWQRGKRHPRALAVSGVAVALTLVGAYALSASGRSLCPPAGDAKAPRFLLLMDPVPQASAGSELKINYDVCGLTSGTAYRGKVRLSKTVVSSKKKSAKPKPMVVTFQNKADGPATRHRQELNLGSTKPGSYILELSVTDNQGRERKKVQKIVIKAE